MTTLKSHSQFLDGTVPGRQVVRFHPSEDRIYIQPALEVADVGSGSTVQPSPPSSLCASVQSGGSADLAGWLKRHQTTLITAGLIYGGYRLLRR